jgi:hypothetical protein
VETDMSEMSPRDGKEEYEKETRGAFL